MENNIKKREKEGCRVSYFKWSLKTLNDSSDHEQSISSDPNAVVHPVHALQQRAVNIQCQPLGGDTDSHMVPPSIRQAADWEPDRETHGSQCNQSFFPDFKVQAEGQRK